MSPPMADELHGWLPSPYMTTSRAAGADRFIGAGERRFRSVDLEGFGPRFPDPLCVRETMVWSFEQGIYQDLSRPEWSARNRGMGVFHHEEGVLDSTAG